MEQSISNFFLGFVFSKIFHTEQRGTKRDWLKNQRSIRTKTMEATITIINLRKLMGLVMDEDQAQAAKIGQKRKMCPQVYLDKLVGWNVRNLSLGDIRGLREHHRKTM